jgi:hypothetical protein
MMEISWFTRKTNRAGCSIAATPPGPFFNPVIALSDYTDWKIMAD